MTENLKFPINIGGTILDGSHELHRVVAMSREGEEGHRDFGLSSTLISDEEWDGMTDEERRKFLDAVKADHAKRLAEANARLSPRARERMKAELDMKERVYGNT